MSIFKFLLHQGRVLFHWNWCGVMVGSDLQRTAQTLALLPVSAETRPATAAMWHVPESPWNADRVDGGGVPV